MSDDFGEGFRGAQFAAPMPPDDEEPPNRRASAGLSGDALLTIIVALIGIACVVFTLDWAGRGFLVVCAIGLTAYATLRHSAHPVKRAAVGLIVVALFIGFSWRAIWDDFHQKHPTVTLSLAEKWIEQIIYGPPKPPPPCVTQEEINNQQKLGRQLLNYCPGELLAMWQSGQDISLYLNKWIKVRATFSNPTSQTINKRRFLVIEAWISSGQFLSESKVAAYFDREKWDAKLSALRPDDPITAICQFNRIDRTPFVKQGDITLYLDKLIAYDCDLL